MFTEVVVKSQEREDSFKMTGKYWDRETNIDQAMEVKSLKETQETSQFYEKSAQLRPGEMAQSLKCCYTSTRAWA